METGEEYSQHSQNIEETMELIRKQIEEEKEENLVIIFSLVTRAKLISRIYFNKKFCEKN